MAEGRNGIVGVVWGAGGGGGGGLPDAAVEALVVRQCSVEGVPHVIDREGGNLDDPVDQEAHRVHQVRLELRVRRQPFILSTPNSTNSSVGFSLFSSGVVSIRAQSSYSTVIT